MAPQVLRHGFGELRDELWPFRAWSDEPHVALHDIEQLRQFVHAQGAQEASDARHTRVVLRRPDRAGACFGIGPHGAELPDAEGAAGTGRFPPVAAIQG